MSAPSPNPVAPERLHAFDAVRGLALMLGVAFHATMSFLPGRGIWIVTDHERSLTLAVVFHVLHAFRMMTFFLVAGFFARMMLERRGTAGFVRDRLKRIGVPLLAGWPILFASIVGVSIWAALRTAALTHTPPPAAPPPAPFPAFPLTHLWFLYLLLVFYAAALLIRAAARLGDPGGRMAGLTDRAVAWLTGSAFAPMLLGAPLAAALAAQPLWPAWFGIPTPDQSLVPNLPAFVGFGMAFGFGWLVNRNIPVTDGWTRRWPVHLAVFTLSIAAGFAITGVAPLLKLTSPGPETAAAAAFCAISAWSGTFAALGLALRFLADHSPARRYIADASYWIYLIHMPIVMALQVVLAPYAWPWPLKYALLLGVAFPLMFASYELVVRHSWLGALLNGRRHPWPARPQTQLGSAPPAEPAP